MLAHRTEQSSINQLLAAQLTSVHPQQIAAHLTCTLCDGLLRFAHTIIDCGHSFCHQCLLQFVRTFKGRSPGIKCPQCHCPLNPVLSKAVMRDVFKQGLVDLIAPKLAQHDRLMVERIKRLFPEFQLDFLLEEFAFLPATQNPPKRQRNEKSQILGGLAEAIKEKLGLTIEEFGRMVDDDKQYQSLLEKMADQPQEQPTALKIDLRPRTQKDFRAVGVSHQMQLAKAKVGLLRRYLEKRVLIRLQHSDELAREVLGDGGAEVRIELQLDGRILQNGQNLLLLPQLEEKAIFYSLLM